MYSAGYSHAYLVILRKKKSEIIQITLILAKMELSSLDNQEHRPRLSDEAPITEPPHDFQDALPPTDQGYLAYVALAGAFLSNFLIWGFALSFGVLQEFWSSTEPFASQGGIAAIGTTSTGVMYLTMPLFLWAFQKWPNARRWSMWLSVPAIAVSLIGASFANTVPQLIVCQGIFYAISGNALVMPTVNLINEWFNKKRGLAIGIAISGDFAGGIAMPLVLQAVLDEVGFRWVSGFVLLHRYLCMANAKTDAANRCRDHRRPLFADPDSG